MDSKPAKPKRSAASRGAAGHGDGAKGAAKPAPAPKPAYSAPALEKGLDVIELLASLSEGVTPSQIAQRLGRSLQEVYRVVVALERRGYLVRPPGEEALILSMRLFDLASRVPPLRRLVDVAWPIMNRLSIETYQAVHLAVLDGLSIRVVSQVDSPAPLGFRLRVGTQNPAEKTASGRLLMAYQQPAVEDWLYGAIAQKDPKADIGALQARVAAIRARGWEMIEGEQLKGIVDVSFPILSSSGFAFAVITMPFLSSAMERMPVDAASRVLFEAASEITALLGGTLERPRFPLGS
ncbi:IclR family transcriptional regulator [Prosthecomicrobium pneumaticum]|uniref:DNA-binding IclR family transcriptional regulator n=1 Tax=Prosthecomicrobium pneumaticum TaxID=81895 RepID=A0A7W9FMJ4_9HYPH|nr:IclR family transcriptional regulator [Prosthecomicrobium pneumaticum]MBB5753404.1 DNA-binding IclR family transcriptional regulator [Prosthecomicrobium pneumaticum]